MTAVTVRRRKPEPPAPGAPAWMATFSDMVIQILAFFILLYTFSTVDTLKFRATTLSLQGALGVMPGASASPQGRPDDPGQDVRERAAELTPLPGGPRFAEPLQELQRQLQAALAGAGATGVGVELLDDRLVVRFKDQALFDSGAAVLKQEAVPALDAVAAVLAQVSNRVRVEGHTDDVPISTVRFPSNWELSAARAAVVVRYLHEFHGIDPRRLEAAGAGEWHPVAGNDTPSGRARNRRVDIVILSAAGQNDDR